MLPKILHWTTGTLLGLAGLVLLLLGSYLVYLGGSVYYVLAGIASIAVAVLMVRGDARAAMLFGSLLALTVPWSLWESELVFLSLLPRLAMWMVICLWFLTPWYSATVRGPLTSRRWTGASGTTGK